MMKKFRNLICLTALLFSFQTGISVSAETSRIEQDIAQIQNFIDENQFSDVSAVLLSSGDGILFHINEDTPEARNQKTAVLDYCYYQGFFSDYKIAQEQEYWFLPSANWTCDILQRFFTDNPSLAHVRYFCARHKDGTSYIIIQKTEDSPEAEEEIRFVQEYCISKSLTEHCEIVFSNEIPDEQESTEICALDTVIRAGDVTLDDNVDVLDVILLNRTVLGKEKLSVLQNAVADVNKDGNVNASDSLVIMKMIVGLV